jgi:hypothetical protein
MRSRATRRSVCSVFETGTLAFGTDMAACSGGLPLPAGERGGVRGFGQLLVERIQNLLENAIETAHHVVVPKSKHEISHRFQSPCPLFILKRADRVLASVKLNDQHRISTSKIDDEAIDGYLPLELPARESATAQPEPQDSLCIRLMPTQSLRYRRVVGHLRTDYAVPNPLTPPLSPAGRGSRPCSGRGRSPSRWHTA